MLLSSENRIPFYVFCFGFAGSFFLRFFRRRSEKKDEALRIGEEHYPEPSYLSEYFRLFEKEDISHLPPKLFAALWVLSEIRSEDVPEMATSLLERGFDTPALRRLAGEHKPTRADIEELVQRTFSELGIATPRDASIARTVLGRHFATEALQRRLDPYDAGEKLAYLQYWESTPLASQIDSMNFRAEHWNESERAEHLPEMLDLFQNYLAATTPSPTP